MLISLGWILSAVIEIIMFVFDTPIYGLAIVCINVFNGIARMDFFSTKAGAEIYTDLSRRIYAIIGVVMIFFFAYQLVLLIINPDGDKKTSTGMVKTTITSLIMIAFLPVLYKYMAIFQEHVLTEGTIPAIVLGTGASGGDADASGRNTALIVYLSMYHPNEGGYMSIIDPNNVDAAGNPSPRSVSECTSLSEADDATCTLWIEAYNNFIGGAGLGGITAFTWNWDLTGTISEDKGSEYYVIIIAVCGCALIWFFASYAIDLGYRTIKLGFLQIITPGPVIMRIFPKTAKTFEKWKHELIKTYLEVFARIFIVSFVIAIIAKVPIIITGLFDALKMSKWCFPFGIVAMVFGILKFGKELPKLAKDIFDNGSGLFNGIDWKPGVGRRWQAGKNDVIGFGKKMAGYGRNIKKGFNKVVGGAWNAPLRAKRGIVRAGGMLKGAKAGAAGAIKSNKATGFGAFRAAIKGGLAGAKSGFTAGGYYNPADKNAKMSDAISLARTAGKDAGSTTETFKLGKYLEGFRKEFSAGAVDARTAKIDELRGNIKNEGKEFYDRMGLTDMKSKADEFSNAELAKIREMQKAGASMYRVKVMNNDGEYSGKTQTFNTASEAEKFINDQKAKVLQNQAKIQFENNNGDAARELLRHASQGIRENYLELMDTTMDEGQMAKIIKDANGKITKDLLKVANAGHAFGDGDEGEARYKALVEKATEIEKQVEGKQTLKCSIDLANRELHDLQESRSETYKKLVAQNGQTVDGVEITDDYIEAAMAKFDTMINEKTSNIKDMNQKLDDYKVDSLDLSKDEIDGLLNSITEASAKNTIGDSETEAKVSLDVKALADILNKSAGKVSSNINISFESGGDSGGSGGDSGGSGGDSGGK